MKFSSSRICTLVFLLATALLTGCAKNRGLTNEEDIATRNREVANAILCGLGGHKMDSSGKCDFSKKSNSSANSYVNRNQVLTNSDNSANGQLIYACGSVGLTVDFASGNCVTAQGRQVNPRNVVPQSIPLPAQNNNELIMRCNGRSVDFVTGRCL